MKVFGGSFVHLFAMENDSWQHADHNSKLKKKEKGLLLFRFRAPIGEMYILYSVQL